MHKGRIEQIGKLEQSNRETTDLITSQEYKISIHYAARYSSQLLHAALAC